MHKTLNSSTTSRKADSGSQYSAPDNNTFTHQSKPLPSYHSDEESRYRPSDLQGQSLSHPLRRSVRRKTAKSRISVPQSPSPCSHARRIVSLDRQNKNARKFTFNHMQMQMKLCKSYIALLKLCKCLKAIVAKYNICRGKCYSLEKYIFDLPLGVYKVLIDAFSDTLNQNSNLVRWGKCTTN